MKKLIVMLILFVLAVSFMLGLNLIYAENSETVEVISSTQCNQVCRETANQELKECREQRRIGLQECRLSTDPNCAEHVRHQFQLCIDAANEQQQNCEFSCEEVTCCLTNDNCFLSIIRDCRAAGGAVMECLGDRKLTRDFPLGAQKNFTPTNLTGNGLLRNLSRDVNATGVHLGNYNASHDCDDFAHELESNLTVLGYNATFTAIWCYGVIPNPGAIQIPPRSGHAVVDVHLSDGRTVFIEPQTGGFVNLDFDGDGVVETDYNYGGSPLGPPTRTDDNCEIVVFDNRAAAAAAGAPID